MLIQTNFIAGKMNKSVDERLVPPGEYVDALNVRLGSTETTEIGAVENSRGNTRLTTLMYKNLPLSGVARCIGAYEDGMRETIYWFVHDESNPASSSGKVDLIVSFETNTNTLTYHVQSETVLNFDPKFLITGVDKIGNFLYFTDDLNPPRFIDVTGQGGVAYPSDAPGTLNPLEEEDLNVIVQIPGFEDPTATTIPLGAPHLNFPPDNQSDEDYMENRFLCFAYRYRYFNEGYSATSLFTKPAFLPRDFNFSLENFLNDGMVNSRNRVNVTFSTGDRRVKEVQLLVKETTSNNIFLVERINKADQGISNDTFITRQFSNKKVLTVIGSDELLRLYDNVPRLAKAQTIQGNRLMYGNYVDQYNIEKGLVDGSGNLQPGGQVIPTQYTLQAVSNELGNQELDPTTSISSSSGVVNIGGGATTVVDGQITIDLSGLPSPIPAGLQISILLLIQNISETNNGGPDVVSTLIPDFDITLIFTAPVSYPTPADLINSSEFQAAIGTSANISPILPPTNPPVIQNGTTLTDYFNNAIYYALQSTAGNTLQLLNTSITGSCPAIPLTTYPPVGSICTQEPIGFTALGSSFRLQLPGAQFYFDTDPANPGQAGNFSNQFNYFAFNPATSAVAYSEISENSSLHSNRDYEVGIVYMDKFGRASTVLTSEFNTVYFGSQFMRNKNQIQVTIPSDVPAPWWADKYKFVVKPTEGAYNTIYSNLNYQQDGSGNATGGTENISQADLASFWFRLEGDSQNIAQVGQKLLVKMDAQGATGVTALAEVLDKKAMYTQQITTVSQPGLYIKLKPSNWTAINPNVRTDINCKKSGTNNDGGCGGDHNNVTLSCGVNDGGVAATIPAGSVVKISIDNRREHKNNNCPGKRMKFTKSIIATQDYANIHAMLVGEQLQNSMITPNAEIADATSITFDPTLIFTNTSTSGGAPGISCFQTKVWVYENGSGEQFIMMNSGMPRCGWAKKRQAKSNFRVQISFSDGLFVFETEPSETDPNLFYDASQLLDIETDPSGFKVHSGATKYNNSTNTSSIVTGCEDANGNPIPCTDQVLGTTPLTTTIDFANCYVFGNGVESMRIQDRIDGKSFELGQRKLAVSNQDFKEADRFAGMTYSGVFSDSANSNNLNEFNLGLVNFKDLETRFGPIMILHSRETDILCLQEDRVSYVLSSKNVVSDSTGGGAIVSVPEVLGTQVARIEEYGISFNPESFVSWGAQMFFTDTKRGVVLSLQGASANSDQLKTISSFGMRSYFRDEFNAALTTQKLGGYDPYMNEYVLSSNDRAVPVPVPEVPCGQLLTQVNTTQDLIYDVNLGPVIGQVDIPYTISSGTINISIVWNGVTYTSGNVSTSGSFSFNKTSSTPDTASVTVTPVSSQASYDLTVECPPQIPLTVVKVVVNTPNYDQESIHILYKWNDGSTFSPTQTDPINLNVNVPTSHYSQATGVRSVGMFPYDGADITIGTTKIGADTFDFDPALHRFKILSSNTLFQNTPVDIALLLTTATDVTPILNQPGIQDFQALESAFNMPIGNQYLYLIWDFRDIIYNELCYEPPSSTVEAVCCECEGNCQQIYFSPGQGTQLAACQVNTNTFGNNYYSFNGSGSVPVLGDQCFANQSCDSQSTVDAGFYVVDAAQPAATNPKNWIQLDAQGFVIDAGTC